MASDYPAWVCRTCGRKYGNRPDSGRLSTWHFGCCDVCGLEASVTEPRDFGHLKREYREGQRDA